MVTVNLAQAKARLSELVNKVEQGEAVTITRHGKPVATLSAADPPKLPFTDLTAFRAKLPRSRVSSTTLIRRMRDERY